MFVRSMDADALAFDISHFMSSWFWFKSYCENKRGKRKKDYKKAFEVPLSWCEGLFEFEKKEGMIPVFWRCDILPIFSEIEKLLNKRAFNENSVDAIWEILNNFDLLKFVDEVRDYLIRSDLKKLHSPPLFDKTYELTISGKYAEAISNTFIYLDEYLRTQLGITNPDLYGEELINHVFSPTNGLLQLDTHQNEQRGLRNLVSGLNALYRNPAAHRFMKYDEDTVSTVIIMVNQIIKLVDKLIANNVT